MILVLNFKDYLKSEEDYLRIIKGIKRARSVEFWLAINPYFYLTLAKKLKHKFKIGLQNLAFVSEKPQTGEVNYDFKLINLADFVLIGHSERYRVGENIEIIKNKIRTLQDKNLKLLIFFSENSYKPKDEFQKTKEKTEKNLKDFLSVIKKENYKKIYFVYEPWWAISTEEGKTPERKFLEDFLMWFRENYPFPIFYGGSYNSKLAEVYRGLNFDGYVLGRASTDLKELQTLVEKMAG